MPSGMLRHMVWYFLPTFRRFLLAGDEGSKHLSNVGTLVPDFTAQRHRKQSSDQFFLFFMFVVPKYLVFGVSIMTCNSFVCLIYSLKGTFNRFAWC